MFKLSLNRRCSTYDYFTGIHSNPKRSEIFEIKPEFVQPISSVAVNCKQNIILTNKSEKLNYKAN